MKSLMLGKTNLRLLATIAIHDQWAIDGAGESYESESSGGFGALLGQLDAIHFYPPVLLSDLFDVQSAPASTR